jgi:oligopeptide transport system ATP-binding protein
MSNEVLFKVENLKKYFTMNKNSVIKAIDNVSFEIFKGETLGLVGESGCGKSTCGRLLLGIYPPTEGKVYFNDKDVNMMNSSDKLKFKNKAQIIFQDPYASLDPRMTIGEIVREGMDVHLKISSKEKEERILDLLEKVGLNEEHSRRFPHELSGGQRQRIGIARALAIEPDFIVCDEPISALDVSVQAQIINLLVKFQKEMQLTYLFISHDLSVVKHISNRVGVMYLGSMVELANNNELYNNPLHPYTQALISSIPIPDPEIEMRRKKVKLPGEVPKAINPLPGCKFRQRCSYAISKCTEKQPHLIEVEKGHYVACHLI